MKSQGEAAECDIERYGDVVYLIPREDNTFLGFSKAQLKQLLCKSGGTDKDYYLSQFVILTLLVEFYDGQGATSKTRDYMRVGELQNCVSGRLREGAERAEEGKRPSCAHHCMARVIEYGELDELSRRAEEMDGKAVIWRPKAKPAVNPQDGGPLY